MNLQTANFEDLLDKYFKKSNAHTAASTLLNMIAHDNRRAAATLLRDYNVEPVYENEEIEARAAIDQLLLFCSILEIASLADFIPDVKSTRVARNLYRILSDANVRRYYEKYYPTSLPQLFQKRLAGDHNTKIALDTSTACNRMLAFLELDHRFMKELDDGYLLRMLDSFEIEGVVFDDLVELIGNQEEFINCLMRKRKKHPRKRLDVLSQAAREFIAFIEFCIDLQALLNANEDDELLQSAIWNQYNYWFDIIGEELRSNLGDALEQFSQWTPVSTDRDDELWEDSDFGGDPESNPLMLRSLITTAQETLESLTSSYYGHAVSKLLDQIGRPKPEPEQESGPLPT